jgi:hypothetical protein
VGTGDCEGVDRMKDKSKTKDGRHRFKWLKYEGENVRIDVDIAPLLTNLWKLGIHTTNSCQASCCYACGHKVIEKKDKDGRYTAVVPTKHCYDHVWLTFPDMRDYERLLNVVAVYEPIRTPWSQDGRTMYELVRSVWKMGTYRGKDDGWEARFYVENRGVQGHFKRHTYNGKRDGFEMWCETGCKKNDFRFEPQIHFPRKHLPYVEERVQLAVDAS